MPNYIDGLFWERYRPKSLNQMVLLPRIKAELGEGFKRNYLLHGHQGTGKSTITRILLKDRDFIRINASLNGKIDTLRDELEDFCTSMKSPFIKSDDSMKYVYMEEFENSTKDFQEAFKAFIEDYDQRVRFIITMNEIQSIKVPALLSRFEPLLKFDPINDEEREFLHSGYTKYLTAVSKHAGLNLKPETITNLINTYFPDLRAAVQGVHAIFLTGNEDIQIQETYTDIYEFILGSKSTFDNIYDFVVDNYTNRPKDLMFILGRPFYKYLKTNHPDIITNKGFNLIGISKSYNENYETTVDPVIHLISYISEIKKTLFTQ
jgi:DNA polymerase III delta prime subunit